jgi:hypothetical protein
LALSLAVLVFAADAVAATGPQEPNDTNPTAYPVASGTPYHGAIEIAGDPDWYTFTPNAAGPVDISLGLTQCGLGAPGPVCSNAEIVAYDADGGIVGRAIANTLGQPAHVAFTAVGQVRYAFQITSGAPGTNYITSASFPTPVVAPPPVSVQLPSVLPPFEARFSLGLIGNPKRPKKIKIRGLVITDVQPGTVIVAECTSGCRKRFSKNVTAKGTYRRLGGFPITIRRTTRFHIEIRRKGFVGRYINYAFEPHSSRFRKRSGCLNPYDFKPILCAS